MKTLGVIGGLGPMATAYFMQLVIDMTEAMTDQEHIPMIIYNCPQIPDRTSYLLGKSQENPGPQIIDCGKKIGQAGAELIAIPCITAHALFPEIEKELDTPVLHIIRETAAYLKQEGIKRVGLEATDGTVQTRVFQKELEQNGIEVILPSKEKQEMVMHIIYNNVKAGQRVDMNRFRQIEQELYVKGAETIILGCTELSMVSRDENIGHGYLDAMEVLARAAVLQCGTLKSKYNRLLT
ncbi:MAG: amino acid racemase [Lachnospiraceae bacterium]|nr:amino acid racemase [Lachnospiraceae bacterium]